MVCRNCGNEIPEGASFCTECGERVVSGTDNSETPFRNNENGYGYQNSDENSYSGYAGGNYNGQPRNNYAPYEGYNYAPPVNDKAATLKDYLKWMLLYPLWNLIPGVGFVLYIIFCVKYALDTAFKARSNYFKAVLICQGITLLIGIVVAVIMFSILGGVMSSIPEIVDEVNPEVFFDYGFEEQFPNLFVSFFGR